jgi:hypothetical protein
MLFLLAQPEEEGQLDQVMIKSLPSMKHAVSIFGRCEHEEVVTTCLYSKCRAHQAS